MHWLGKILILCGFIFYAPVGFAQSKENKCRLQFTQSGILSPYLLAKDYELNIQNKSLDELEGLRNAGRKSLEAYFLGDPILEDFFQRIPPKLLAQDEMREALSESIDRIISTKIRRLAYQKQQEGDWPEDLMERQSFGQWLPLEYGGAKNEFPEKTYTPIVNQFANIIGMIQLPDTGQIFFGEGLPSTEADSALVQIKRTKGRSRAHRLQGADVVDFMDIDSQDIAVAAALIGEHHYRIQAIPTSDRTLKPELSLEVDEDVFSINFDKNGRLILVLSTGIRVLSIENDQLIDHGFAHRFANSNITAAKQSPDRRLIAVGFENGGRGLINLEDMQVEMILNHENRRSSQRHSRAVDEIGFHGSDIFFLSHTDGVISKYSLED